MSKQNKAKNKNSKKTGAKGVAKKKNITTPTGKLSCFFLSGRVKLEVSPWEKSVLQCLKLGSKNAEDGAKILEGLLQTDLGQKGVEGGAREGEGRMFLAQAVLSKTPELLQLLLTYAEGHPGIEQGYEAAIDLAILEGKTEMIKMMLDKKGALQEGGLGEESYQYLLDTAVRDLSLLKFIESKVPWDMFSVEAMDRAGMAGNRDVLDYLYSKDATLIKVLAHSPKNITHMMYPKSTKNFLEQLRLEKKVVGVKQESGTKKL